MTDGAMSLRFLAGSRDDGVREGWRSMLECLIHIRQAILSSERHTAERVRHFTESIIRDMTRINNNLGGVNMAQGFPDFPPPSALIEAAEEACKVTSTSMRTRGARGLYGRRLPRSSGGTTA